MGSSSSTGPVRAKDVVVPGQAGASIIKEEVSKPLANVIKGLRKKKKK